MLDPAVPALVLAPMEGVTDAPMRAVQGESGVFAYAVSEFLRVSHGVPPRAVFDRHVPELLTGCRTLTGLPVQVQLLGGDANLMAETAARLVEAGAAAIDINFGCPAKTVNRHDGGATLLKHPTRLREIVRAIRTAVPMQIPVSAKLRLGWDRTDAIFENATMAADGGASWLTIHARTRMQGYAPPVSWTLIGRVRERLKLPIIANGDIWTLADFRTCRAETGCEQFMLGRGALANPHLAGDIAAELGLRERTAERAIDWPARLRSLAEWTRRLDGGRFGSVIHRWKQWLSLAAKHGTFGGFEAIKRAKTPEELLARFDQESLLQSAE